MTAFAKLLLLAVCLAASPGLGALDLPWLLVPRPGGGERSRGLQANPGAGIELEVAPAEAAAPDRWQPGTRWRFPMPSGPAVALIVDDQFPSETGGVLVRGHLEGEAGSEVMLSAVEGRMAGILRRASGERILLQPRSLGRHVLGSVPRQGGPVCGNRDGAPGVVLQGQRPSALPDEPGGAPSVLDLAFFHTGAATAAAGGTTGIRALLGLALAEANDAYTRSDARVRLRPVCILPVDYAESGDLATDLDRLGRTEDGWLDEVHALRDRFAADAVCLVTEFENSNQFAGMANQLAGTEPALVARAFAVCLRPYLIGNYSLPHEIGHLLGCNHDRDNAVDPAIYPWSFGARIEVDGELYRTIMAYRPGLQFPHFSNPNVLFHGVPTGIKGVADNVRTMHHTGPLVASAREAPSRLGFDSADVTVSETSGGVRLTLSRAGDLRAATVAVRTQPGSAREGIDYDPRNEVLPLAAGVPSMEIVVPVLDTATVEGPRRFAVVLSDPSSGLALGPISMVTVTISDDETEASATLDTGYRTRPGADYEVTSLAVLPGGEAFVAGGFASFNGEPHSRVVRLRSDGTVNPDFQAEVKYRVNVVAALDGGRVAVAGEFNTVNGARRNHVAVLGPDGALDPGFEFEVGADAPVNALLPFPAGGLVIAGQFTTVQGAVAMRVARLQSDGSPEASFDSRSGPDGEVLGMALDGNGSLVIGGRFRRVGARPCGGLARLDALGTPDERFPAGAGAGANGPVHAVAVEPDGRVLAAGDFDLFEGRPAGRIVRLSADGQREEAFAAGSGPDDAVLALLVRPDGAIWIAGKFTHVHGRARNRLARLLENGALDEAFDPGVGPNDWVLALAESGSGGVLVGGVFTEVNGVARGGLAAVLAQAPAPPRFTRAWRGEWGVEWEAAVSPRQSYDVDASVDLRRWWIETDAQASDGRARGVLPESRSTGFLRLRRRLE